MTGLAIIPPCSQVVKPHRRRSERGYQSLVLSKFLSISPAISTSSRIKFFAILVSHLATRLTAAFVRSAQGASPHAHGWTLPVLAAFTEALVQIGPDDTLVELGASDVLHAIESILMGVVFDEAETAWGFVEAIKAHDQTLDLTTFRKQLVDLLFGRIEGPGE